MPSITVSLPNLQATGPVVDIHIAVGADLEADLQRDGQDVPVPIAIRAQIDTGAPMTMIRDDLPGQLGLTSERTQSVSTVLSENGQGCVYKIRLLLPNRIRAAVTALGDC